MVWPLLIVPVMLRTSAAESVSTIVGSLTDGWTDDVGLSAAFSNPQTITASHNGQYLFVSEFVGRVRVIRLSDCTQDYAVVECSSSFTRCVMYCTSQMRFGRWRAVQQVAVLTTRASRRSGVV